MSADLLGNYFSKCRKIRNGRIGRLCYEASRELTIYRSGPLLEQEMDRKGTDAYLVAQCPKSLYKTGPLCVTFVMLDLLNLLNIVLGGKPSYGPDVSDSGIDAQ